MILSVQQIKYEILAYIREFGDDYRDWVIGIADQPRARMAEWHGVDLEADIWLYKQAVNNRACVTVVRFFTEKLGVEGEAVASADEEFDCVYLFRKSARTRPAAPAPAETAG